VDALELTQSHYLRGAASRIQVGEVRGDVVELGALTTTLLEVNHASSRQTGRSMVLRNSVFVAQSVFDETFAGAYGLRSLRVPLAADADWRAAELGCSRRRGWNVASTWRLRVATSRMSRGARGSDPTRWSRRWLWSS